MTISHYCNMRNYSLDFITRVVRILHQKNLKIPRTSLAKFYTLFRVDFSTLTRSVTLLCDSICFVLLRLQFCTVCICMFFFLIFPCYFILLLLFQNELHWLWQPCQTKSNTAEQNPQNSTIQCHFVNSAHGAANSVQNSAPVE